MAFIGFFEFVCIVGFFGGIVWLVISFIRRRKKKKPIILIVSTIILTIALTLIAGMAFQEEMKQARIEREQRERKKDEKQKEKEQEEEKKKEEEKQKKKEETERKEQERKEQEEEKKAEEEKKKKEEEEEKNKFNYDEMDVEFIEYKIEENMVGDECFVLYFDFANNSDENAAFMYKFSVKAFQNGVEMESSWNHVNDETKNHGKEIQPGTTIRVADAFYIEDKESPIDIEVGPWASFSNKKLFQLEIKPSE